MSPNSTDPLDVLAARFREAIVRAFPALGAEPVDPLVAPTRGGKPGSPAVGDFQCNAAMPLAKRLGLKPRDVASAIVKQADIGELAEPLTEASIAGPGFINITLRPDALRALLARLDAPGLGVLPALPAQTVVVDLMGVNLAKEMHVGHLRSPVIGDAIARVLARLGHRVLRQNHVGDWGLNIAMVTERVMRLVRAGALDLNTLNLSTLDKAYVAAQNECQRDLDGLNAVRRFGLGPKAAAELEEQVAGATEAFTRARQALVRLQAGDPEVRAVWERIAEITMSECLAVCRRLHVRVGSEHSAGESTYAAELAPMIADLEARGIAVLDQGALIVRLDDQHPPANPYGPIKEPCLVRKSDGGFLYATTDIAAVRRRVQQLGAQRVVYVIDIRQNLHLRQVWASAARAGYANLPGGAGIARLEHAAFGFVMGEDGRPFKTRSGDNVKLADLLQETIDRATAAVTQRSPDLPAPEAALIAEAVGVAALKYSDLCNDRAKDYVFSFDRMLAFEGNTGPYLLYALVRIKSIFRKAAERAVGQGWENAPYRIQAPAEKTLAMALLRYPGTVHGVGESLEPHRLCQYLFELAGAFSSFFDACPVIQAEDDETRRARLKLCDLSARVLADGLELLGIPFVERM